MDTSRLTVEHLIVHEIPLRRAQETAEPILSELESDLDDDVRTFFRDRLTEGLRRNVFMAERDPDSESPVPGLVSGVLSGAQFIPASQEIARFLTNKQNAVNSPGLLAVLGGRSVRQPWVAVMKLEKEEGARVNTIRRGGQRLLSVEYLRELILSGRTKVYKLGLLYGDPLEGQVCDLQRPQGQAASVAEFFLRDFLGFRYQTEPALATKDWYEATEEYFDDSVPDAETRTRYQFALLSELNSNRTMIRPASFAQDHLQVEHRQPYIESLRDAGITDGQIQKDVSRVSNRLRRVEMKFRGGVKLTGTPEAMEDVNVQGLDDGRTRAEVEDWLDEVR